MQTKEVIFVSEKVANLESMISQFPNIACSYFKIIIFPEWFQTE